MCTAASAVAFILDHGHFATVTPDGVLAHSICGIRAPEREDDEWFEEPTVFEIDENGGVSTNAVRSWLGY